MKLVKRTTVLFDPLQYRALKRLARMKGQTVGELIRVAVSRQYQLTASGDSKEAVERLAKMSAPVGDWESMEREIMKGALDE